MSQIHWDGGSIPGVRNGDQSRPEDVDNRPAFQSIKTRLDFGTREGDRVYNIKKTLYYESIKMDKVDNRIEREYSESVEKAMCYN